MRKFLFLFCMLLFLTSCFKEGDKKEFSIQASDISDANGETNLLINSFADFSIELSPSEPRGNSYVELLIKNLDPEKLKIEWFVNGRPIRSGTLKISTEGLVRDDVIGAKVFKDDNLLFSKELRIKNTPPEFKSVKLMPEVFRPGDTLYIDAEAMDPDGDEVTIYYEWYKNNELVSTEKNLNIPVKRGDKLIIKIKTFDGKDYGEVITLNREILNLPPVIIEHRDYHFDGNIFTYHVKATDPDGDDLSYSLKSSPPGMTINSSTGLILWNLPPDFKDRSSVTVSVTDGHGGEAFYSFIVTIRSEER